jgi:hypothetical protein
MNEGNVAQAADKPAFTRLYQGEIEQNEEARERTIP